MGRQALHPEALDNKKPPGMFFFLGLVNPGRHVKIRQISPTEGTSRCLEAGQLDILHFIPAFRIEATHTGSVTEGDPEVTIFIDGHPVR